MDGVPPMSTSVIVELTASPSQQLDALLEEMDAERGTAFSFRYTSNGPDGEYRSVILRDLDGTLLELVEFPSENYRKKKSPESLAIRRLHQHLRPRQIRRVLSGTGIPA